MLQLVAGRLLAPYIGVALVTWTAIIGVFLTGISLGNWLGGRLADRSPSAATLSWLCLLGSLSTLAMLGLVLLLGDGNLVRSLPLLPRIALLTMVICLPPSLILSMITPVAIKVMLPDVRSTGSITGLVYALGTLGSLAGNFLTGFLLVALLPINEIVLAVALLLLVLGLLTGNWWSAAGRREAAARPTLVFDQAPPSAATPAALAARSALALPGNVPLACTIVALASFCSMAIELAASRLLAPHIGISLYSWTGIIGVVLAGIALGNFLGGRLADRWPRPGLLGACLLLAGLASLSVLALLPAATGLPVWLNEQFSLRFGLWERIMLLAAVLFFVPVLLLGTISPQVTRLAVTDLRSAGQVAGRIYAWSTAGAILGTFVTGWLLISLLGVNMLIFLAGLGLIGLALLAGRFWRNPLALALSLVIAAGAVVGLVQRDALRSSCTMETNYFCIRVDDDIKSVGPVKKLVLDHLVHSYVKLGDPSYLGYEHEQVQAEMTRYMAAQAPRPQVLVIGGGGYTYPRWVDAFVPQATVEVVEIDPGVTEVVYRELGLPRDTRIISHNLDGRQFVHELAQPKSYSLVVQDAVNDLSVPYHIMTKEYNDDIKAILTDNGAYLLTVIDLYQDGQLMRSAMRTMRQTFPYVHLLSTYPAWSSPGASVFVIYGSQRPLNLEEMRGVLLQQGVPLRTMVQPDNLFQAYIDEGPQIILTDQYAPVDNLISILFSRRNG